MLKAEERGLEAPPALFPPWQPERAKVRARPKTEQTSWEAGLFPLFHVLLGGTAGRRSTPHLQRNTRRSLALNSLWLCRDQPSRYGLTRVTAMSNSLGAPCVLWLLWVGHPDNTATGTTWLPLRRRTRSPPWSGAGTMHSWPGGRRCSVWWCDPWGINPPAIHLQPSICSPPNLAKVLGIVLVQEVYTR